MAEIAEDEQARAQARIGRVLKEKWTLDKLLGVGGMGAVYAATHRNKKRGAVKVLHPELSAEPSIRQRFLREGYVANSVGHRGAVEVFDDDVAEDGSAYLVMELLEGESVEARWERKGRKLPAREVLAIADQLLETLAEAHAKDIVHRDLKPENLFLQKGGVLKVLDFGIARLRETGKSATATQTGSAMGTPAFMAPEQARGRWEEVDGRTDLWALGASMFTLLTGQYVHGLGTVNEIMARAITQPVPSLGSVAGADLALVTFVDKSLAYTPAERFQNALEMQTALRELYHTLDGQHSMRAVQPSIPDGVVAADAPSARIVAAAASAGGDAVAAPAPSNATLTTGRALVTSALASTPAASGGLPKWVPLAAGGGALALVAVLVLALSGGVDADVPKAAADAPAAPTPAAPTPVQPQPPSIAADAPRPPSTADRAVDIQSLPTVKAAPSVASQAPASKPPVALLDAINPNSKPAAAPPPPAAAPPPASTKPAAAKPPANLFKKRQ